MAKGDKKAMATYLENKHSEGNTEACLSQAEILIQQQRFEEAINTLKAATVKQSSLWRKHYLLGLCCYALDRTTDSQSYLRKATELNSRSDLPLLVLREVVPAGPDRYFIDEQLMEMRTQLSESYIESAQFLATIGEQLDALKCLQLLLRNTSLLNREVVENAEKVWWRIASDAELSKADKLAVNQK